MVCVPISVAKPFKVVGTAVMRKLVVILKAILRPGQPWHRLKTA